MEQFEVIFLDDDELTVLDKQLVNKGAHVTYNGKAPEKDLINGIKYVFIGWTNEELLESVEQNVTVIAKYVEEGTEQNIEDSLFNATLETAKKTDLNATIHAGNKLTSQKEALEKDSRSPEEIVEEVLKKGEIEIGSEIEKDDSER